MKKQRIRNMTSGTPAKLMIAFALPLMAGNVFQQLYTMVDTAVVGQFLGVHALASVGTADWLSWLPLGIMQGLTQGFSILVAQYFGAGDKKEMNRSIGMSFSLCFISAAILLILAQIIIQPVLTILNTPLDVLPGAVRYLRVLYCGIPAVMMFNFFASILRALGDSKTPLYAMIVAALTNVGLDLLFVVVFHWGIAGASFATVIAQILSAVYCFINMRKVSIINVSKGDFSIEKKRLLPLLRLGSPIAFQNFIIAVGGMVVQSVINKFGVLFIAGFTATNKLYGTLEIAATSYGFAVTSFVGQNLGAGLKSRIKKGMRSAVVIAFFTSLAISTAMLIFGKLFLGLFIEGTPSEIEVSMGVAYRYLTVMSLSLSILYMLHIYRSALMGIGNTIIPMISGIAELILRIVIVMSLPLLIGRDGVYFAEVGAWIAAASILCVAYYRNMKNVPEDSISQNNNISGIN